MSTFYYALNSNGDYIYDNFPPNIPDLFSNFIDNGKPFRVEIDGISKNVLLAKKVTNAGTIWTLTHDLKYLNRPKIFKRIVDMSGIALLPLANFQKQIIEEQKVKTEEFIHNVTSLNTYSIQDLFTLIPQDTLSKNINTQRDFIKTTILAEPNNTVSTLLQLIKYNLAMKVEFSVFERTQKAPGFVKKFSHSIRSIILSILQIFIDDFEKRGVDVTLDAGQDSEKRLEVDYDSLFVSLFYLLENSLKYCAPNSKFKIIFKEEKESFSILFIMISLRIEDNEVAKLITHGYRSENAKKVNAEGKGIGMFRIIKTLKMNNATLEITPRAIDYSKNIGNIIYEGNQFKILFKGQQDWFRTV